MTTDRRKRDAMYNRSEKGRARWLRYAHKKRGKPFTAKRTPEQWDHVFKESKARDDVRRSARLDAHRAWHEERAKRPIEARAASAYEHWVGSKGLSFWGRDDASGSATLVKFHWRGGRQGRRGVRSRAQLPRPRRGRPDRARLHVRRRLGMGAALLAEQEGSVGE
jgi:hypothetical protein